MRSWSSVKPSISRCGWKRSGDNGDIHNKLAEKWAALYVRLSRGDENEGDSNSIAHQIEILTKYCKDHGITQHKIYKDDGFSGTNFNRPGFKEMLSDIEAGLVGAVIVKDDCVILEPNAESP